MGDAIYDDDDETEEADDAPFMDSADLAAITMARWGFSCLAICLLGLMAAACYGCRTMEEYRVKALQLRYEHYEAANALERR
jgi:hypothetical protein